MGSPTGSAAVPNEGKSIIIVYNNCLYPSPPTKLEVILEQTDTFAALRGQVSEKTGNSLFPDKSLNHHSGYSTEAFELFFGSQKLPFQDSDDIKTLQELKIPIGKSMIQLRRKQGAKVQKS
jgi:hypothetical protein